MSKRAIGLGFSVLTVVSASVWSAPVELSSRIPVGKTAAVGSEVPPSGAEAFALATRTETFASLKTVARQKGNVDVIVHVAVDRIDALTTACVSAHAPQLALQADAQLADAIDTGVRRELANLAGVAHTVGHTYGSIPFVAMRVSEDALNRLEASPGVIGIEEDRLARPSLNNTVNITGASAAWAGGLDGTGWTVAILDTGVLSGHEFFSTKTIEQACFARGSNGAGGGGDCPNGGEVDLTPGAAEPYPNTWVGYDHGTHVSGIAAGNGPGNPAAGVARGADLMVIKVFSLFAGACGGADCLLAPTSDQIAAMDYIFSLRLTRNFASINLSLGGGNFSDQAACDASNAAQKASIDVLRAAGIATVIASGNGASCTGIGAPACISSAIAVGGTTDADNEYSSNDWHPTLMDIFAPGVGVLSSVAASPTSYASFSGTSMAAPHVAGAFAILRQADPGASVTDIFNALDQSGQPVNGGCGQPVPQRRIQIDDAITLLGFDACCQDGGVCTDTTATDCAALGGKFRPGHSCGDIPSPCVEDVKFSQVPDGTGESIASNIDLTDMVPNTVTADDFTSDGRAVRSVKWWGSELGPTLDEYVIDDGTSENGIGFTGGGDIVWINQFNVLPGLETITTVSVAWDTVANGTAATIVIYDDPNNDGDPTDAVLLTTQPATVANADTDILNLIDIADTNVGAVGDSFFVGAFMAHANLEFPASVDQSSDAGRSWIAGGASGTGDFVTLINNELPPATLAAVGLSGNWLVRADAGLPPIDSTPDGWFLSFHEPISTDLVDPVPPLGLYYCDQSIVSTTSTIIEPCDSKPILEYRADLASCCLVQATPDSRSGAVPAAVDGFFEERCVDYALDVQGVIGTRFDDVGGVCTEVATGRTVDVTYWGWHTAPASGAAFGLSSAFTSTVSLSGADWLYGPWGATTATCATPDMAFELITDEILDGNPDANGNGYPDSCECTSISGAVADAAGVLQNRYIPFTVLPPTGVGSNQAIQVELVDLPLFPAFNGEIRWVGAPSDYPDPDNANPDRTFVAAGLSCTPHFADWSTIDLLQVFGGEIMPGAEYAVRIFDDCCSDLNDPSCFSLPLTINTGRYGDIIEPFWANPGDVEPSFVDINQIVIKFLGDPGSLEKAKTQFQPNVVFPNNAIDFRDISANVGAFLGTPYDGTIFTVGPCTCPSSVTCGTTACATDSVCGGGFCVEGFCADACARCEP